jgi:hypothetical protein
VRETTCYESKFEFFGQQVSRRGDRGDMGIHCLCRSDISGRFIGTGNIR